MKKTELPSEFFIRNRQELSESLPDSSLTIVCANLQYPKNGDQFYDFRQDSDFFYLTGMEVPDCVLIMYKTGGEYREVIFTKETNDHIMLWEGPRPDKELASEISGVKDVRWLKEFRVWLESIKGHYDKLFMNLSAGLRSDTQLTSSAKILFNEHKELFSFLKPFGICPRIQEQRLVKSSEEIAMIRKAVAITKGAYLKVLKDLKPSMREYEVEAIMRYEMQVAGAHDMSFAPIMASGSNACILHYVHNDDVCKDGDLLLMDFGADFTNYAADCSRTIPVNGKFSLRQAQVYNAVLEVYFEAQKLFKPGTTIHEINVKTGEFMEEKLKELGLITSHEIRKQDSKNPAYKQYFPHGTTHFIGLDVHDVGGKDVILQPGMILSCEPGIYIREEGIGVRIETDMLITENGAIDLMADFPVAIPDIENSMK